MGDLWESLARANASGSPADREAFLEKLYSATHGLLMAVVSSRFPWEAEDLVSDIFAFKVLPLPLSAFIKVQDDLNAYMARIAINYCNDVFRARQREAGILQEPTREWLRGDRTVRPFVDGRLDPGFLANHLSPIQAKVVLLRFNDGLQFGEIQRKLDLATEDAVRKHLCRAKRRLVPVFTTGSYDPE